MKKTIILLFLTIIFFSCGRFNQDLKTGPFVLVIHGGAGGSWDLSDEEREEYMTVLSHVLEAGDGILRSGGTSLDAVETAVRIMEDSPLFNAGKGAVFTEAGKNELDASIMDGSTHEAGAVAGVSHIRNPISAARAVMKQSPHVLLTGKGAEAFAMSHGLEMVDSTYFFTESRWESLQRAKSRKMGTVGAVALDIYGNLAAATSTGGMTNKMTGRVGDSPIIGAGTYADNATCAVSATGHGEFFIRNVVAYDIAARMKYKGETLQKAAGEVVNQILKEQSANGGVIAVDANGNIAMPFNTESMIRGYVTSEGETEVFLPGK